MVFQNFLSGERKRHMIRFGMFPSGYNLSWVDEAPIGAGGAPVYQDLSSGANGSNQVFVLSSAPATQDSLTLYLNGLLQKRGTSYSIAGNTITMTAAPQSGDLLMAYYWV